MIEIICVELAPGGLKFDLVPKAAYHGPHGVQPPLREIHASIVDAAL